MDTKIWAFSRFTTVKVHFHRMVFVESEKQHCFVRRCVSMLQSSAAAKWHCGLCTSIAKILRATVNRGFGRTNGWECNSLMQAMLHQ